MRLRYTIMSNDPQVKKEESAEDTSTAILRPKSRYVARRPSPFL